MLPKVFNRKPSAPSRSPVVQATQQREEDEHTTWRRSLVERVSKTLQDAARAEADLIEKVKPIEARLAALRSEIEAFEAQLAPLARERLGTMSAADAEVAQMRGELSADAFLEVQIFQRILERTREAVLNDVNGGRFAVLKISSISQAQIEVASQALYDAWNDARNAAFQEIDVESALAGIRERLRQTGIGLVE